MANLEKNNNEQGEHGGSADTHTPEFGHAPKGEVTASHLAGVAAGEQVGPLTELVKASNRLQRAMISASFKIAAKAKEAFAQNYTEGYIKKWVDEDAAHMLMPDGSIRPDDGSSPGGRYYTSVKEENDLSKLNMFVRPFTREVLTQVKEVQNFLRSPEMADHFERVHEQIEQIYHRDYPEIAKQIRWHGTLFDERFNHKFLTETRPGQNGHGKIIDADPNRVAALFKPLSNLHPLRTREYPHIVFTSSHARGETFEDVRCITHGIEAMVRDSTKVPLKHGYYNEGVKSGQVLTLYACDVEESPWRNGAALLNRINTLKALPKNTPDKEFKNMSPGAMRIAKMMLKCMVEHPEDIDVNDTRRLSDIRINNAKPITLRADAQEVARHFHLIGYSKGGNVVSDAMRYMVAELTAKREDGKDLFQLHVADPTIRKSQDRTMSQHNVCNIMRSIPVLALASVEVGMSDFDKNHGIRRLSINNEDDLISAHHNFESTKYDERLIIKGSKDHLGHSPQEFLGTRGLDKEFKARGYVHNDKRAARRLKEFEAPLYGKAAVGHLVFNGHAADGEVTLEAATGTTADQIVARKTMILEAVNEAWHPKRSIGKHLSAVAKYTAKTPQLSVDHDNPGVVTLTCPGADFAHNREDLIKLRDAMKILRHPVSKGLVIADTILTEDLPAQINLAKATVKQENAAEKAAKHADKIKRQNGENRQVG